MALYRTEHTGDEHPLQDPEPDKEEQVLGARREKKGLRKVECQKVTMEVEKTDTVGETQCQKQCQKVKRFHLILLPVNEIYQCLPPPPQTHTHRNLVHFRVSRH